jgi:hypothetical protein
LALSPEEEKGDDAVFSTTLKLIEQLEMLRAQQREVRHGGSWWRQTRWRLTQ